MRQSGVRLIFNQKPFFSHHTPTIQVFGLMKENSLSLSLFQFEWTEFDPWSFKVPFFVIGDNIGIGKTTLILVFMRCWRQFPPEWKILSDNTCIQLPDLKQAIRQTKTTTAPGCCGWTQPDLMCVPDSLLEKLIQLWNGFLDGECSMANEPSPCKNCYPQEDRSHFEHDGRPTYHNPFPPL